MSNEPLELKVSSVTIRIMLACHYSLNPLNEIMDIIVNQETRLEQTDWLMKNELIDKDYHCTGKGSVWIEGLLSLPLPVIEWKIPDE